MILDRLSWRVTCPNHASFRLLTVYIRGFCSRSSCAPGRKHEEVSTKEEKGGETRPTDLEFSSEADGVSPPYPVYSGHAAIAEEILMRTCAQQIPFLHTVAPRYKNLVTFSNFWPIMLTFALLLFVLLAMIVLVSVLTSIADAVTLSTSLLVRS